MNKFIHVREEKDDRPLPTGGVTVDFDLNRDTNEVNYAYSRCHPNDHYNKKLGRAKSEGKLHSAHHRHHFKLEGSDPVVVQVLSHVWEDISTEIRINMEKRV